MKLKLLQILILMKMIKLILTRNLKKVKKLHKPCPAQASKRPKELKPTTWEAKRVNSVGLTKIGLIRTQEGRSTVTSISKRSICFISPILISSIRLILIILKMLKCGPSSITSRIRTRIVKFTKSSNQSLRETVWTNLLVMSCSMSFIRDWIDKD